MCYTHRVCNQAVQTLLGPKPPFLFNPRSKVKSNGKRQLNIFLLFLNSQFISRGWGRCSFQKTVKTFFLAINTFMTTFAPNFTNSTIGDLSFGNGFFQHVIDNLAIQNPKISCHGPHLRSIAGATTFTSQVAIPGLNKQ